MLPTGHYFLLIVVILLFTRGMEKKMIDTYKDSKKTELRFVKNRSSWRHHKTGASAPHRYMIK